MHDCAFCGSTDVERVTATFEERQGGVTVRVDGVPALQCRSCRVGGEPAVTLGVAKALQAAYDLIFDAAANSEPILAASVSPESAR